MNAMYKALLRHLTWSFLVFCAIVLLGAVIFWAIEDWSFLDAFYYATQTATAVGTGDIAPVKTASKIVFFPYSIIGVSSFFLMFTTLIADIMKIKQ